MLQLLGNVLAMIVVRVTISGDKLVALRLPGLLQVAALMLTVMDKALDMAPHLVVLHLGNRPLLRRRHQVDNQVTVLMAPIQGMAMQLVPTLLHRALALLLVLRAQAASVLLQD